MNNYQDVKNLKLSDELATKNNPQLITDTISSYQIPSNIADQSLSIGSFKMIKFSGTFEDVSELPFEFYVLSAAHD